MIDPQLLMRAFLVGGSRITVDQPFTGYSSFHFLSHIHERWQLLRLISLLMLPTLQGKFMLRWKPSLVKKKIRLVSRHENPLLRSVISVYSGVKEKQTPILRERDGNRRQALTIDFQMNNENETRQRWYGSYFLYAAMKRRENPKGNKEIWESREMSLVVFMKVVTPSISNITTATPVKISCKRGRN